MNPVWKCAECECGPCYIQAAKSNPGTVFGEDDGRVPMRCPYSDENRPDFEFCAPDVHFTMRYCEEMYEWLSGPGYDNAPPEIRDALAVDLRGRIDGWRAMEITGLLREYEEETGFGWIAEREEWERKMKKVSRIELLNAIFPEGFKAGIIYAEMIRQRRERADGSPGWTP